MIETVTKYTCDKCGCETKTFGFDTLTVMMYKNGNNRVYNRLDLCGHCYETTVSAVFDALEC